MTQAKRKQNQTFECLKLFAAFFIVFAHVPLPGKAGELIDCLVRFSVPLFFAISGYFSFGVRSGKIAARLWHIVKLNLVSVAAIVGWGCAFAAMKGESAAAVLRGAIPDLRELANWIFLHLNPVYGHLWYLAAIAGVYAVFWLYVAFFGEEEIDYRPLYLISVTLLFIRFAAGDLPRKAGIELPYYYFRDGWFYGLPMFSMGLFIRQYQERLFANYRLTTPRLLLMLSLGIALSLLQFATFGPMELPVGAIIQAAAMILLALRYPTVDFGIRWIGKVVSTFGFVSTVVYVLQFCVYDAYAHYLSPQLAAIIGWRERWIRPLLIALGACAVGYALYFASLLLKKLLRKT